MEAAKSNIKNQCFGAKGGNSATYGPRTGDMPGSSPLRPKALVATYMGMFYFPFFFLFFASYVFRRAFQGRVRWHVNFLFGGEEVRKKEERRKEEKKKQRSKERQ